MEKELFTISEVSKKVGLIDSKTKKPLNYILRFWETKFPQIKPITLNGKRRFYSIKDIETVKLIKHLLKDNKLTIEGAKKLMKKKINPLDGLQSSSIKGTYLKENIKKKSKIILEKIRKLKK